MTDGLVRASSADETERLDIHLTSGAFWGDDPHRGLRWLRENDPVHWDSRGGVWGITKYHDVRAVSRNPGLFSSAQGIRPDSGPASMMIDMDDPDHWKRRKLVNKGFTPRRIRDQHERLTEICNALIDRVCETGQADFVRDIAAWLPLIVIGDLLGAAPDQYGDLLRWSDDLVRGQGQSDNPEAITQMIEAYTAYNEYFTGVLDARRADPRDDLISVLMKAQVDGDRLDDDSLRFESLLLLIGGDETTRHVISGGLFQLLADRDQWERLAADRSLLPPAIEEMLRWVSPVKNMARSVTRDTTFGGKDLREGQKLLLLYPSANRDADVFADPFRFDITRSPNDHVAFGIGAHFCLGNSLARLELSAVFTCLLDRLPDIRLVSPDEPPGRPANFVSGYENLPVAFTPTARVGAGL